MNWRVKEDFFFFNLFLQMGLKYFQIHEPMLGVLCKKPNAHGRLLYSYMVYVIPVESCHVTSDMQLMLASSQLILIV